MLVIFGGQQFMANRPRYVNAFIYVSLVIRMCRARVREWREWKRTKSIISSHTSGTSTGQTRVTQFSLSLPPKLAFLSRKSLRLMTVRSYDVVRAAKINTCARFNQSKTLPMRTISKNIGKTGSEAFQKFSHDSMIWHRQKSRDCDTHQQITKAVRLFLITDRVWLHNFTFAVLFNEWIWLGSDAWVSFDWLIAWALCETRNLRIFNATRREIPDVAREKKIDRSLISSRVNHLQSQQLVYAGK